MFNILKNPKRKLLFRPKLGGWKPDPANKKYLKFERSSLTLGTSRNQYQNGDDVDLRPYSSPRHNQLSTSTCFPSGTRILMGDNTEREIEDIGILDTVKTATGSSGRVIETMKRSYSGKMITVTCAGNPYPITATEDHPIFACKNHTPSRAATLEKGNYIPIKDLKIGDYILMTIPNPFEKQISITVEKFISNDTISYEDGTIRMVGSRNSHRINSNIEVSEEFARLIGLFLAEGGFKVNNGHIHGITFTFGHTEMNYCEFVINALNNIGALASIVKSKPNVLRVLCNNATVGHLFLELCGRGALNKKVPELFFSAPKNIQKALIRGWYEGDGTKNKIKIYDAKNEKARAVCIGVTSSEELHRGLQRLLIYIGTYPAASIRKQTSHQNAHGRDLVLYSKSVTCVFPEHIKTINDYNITFRQPKNYKEHEYGFLCRIKDIQSKEVNDIDVYNMEVSEENTYVANNFGVHNCVGQSVIKSLEIKRIMKHGHEKHVDLSVLDIYWGARERMNPPQTGVDSGTYISLACDVLRKFGVCREELHSFKTENIFKAPPIMASREARLNRIEGHFKIKTQGSNRIDDMIFNLKAGNPIVFGTSVGTDWFRYNGGKNPIRVEKDPKGGHALCVVGFINGLFIIENSWSENWGEDGFAYVSPEVFTHPSTRDIWVMVDGSEAWTEK